MNSSRRYVVLGLSILLLNGCATFSASNLFSHYSAQNSEVYQAVAAGSYTDAAQDLDDGTIGGDILDNMERGRVFWLAQQYPKSMHALHASDEAVEALQQKAKISLSETATSLGSLAINDNLNTYTPADYELGFLHLYLGLNYLHDNHLEDAIVEMRRANAVQKKAREQRQKALKSAQRKLSAEGISPNLGSVLAHYPNAGKTLDAVQNGYLFLLSGLLYEAEGELNDAYVDYRRALAVAPNNPTVIQGTLRVAKSLGMQQDYTQLQARYGKPTSLSARQGRVIIIDEQGVVDPLRGWELSLPLYGSQGNLALYSVALPHYPNRSHPPLAPLVINGHSRQVASLIDVNRMAKFNLNERMPVLLLRQAIRVLAKNELRKDVAKQDQISGLVMNIWNTLTEQPDTRSWMTLPAKVGTISRVVPAGEQTLTVSGHNYRFDVAAGKTVLVWMSRQGQQATLWHKQLGQLQ
ncbi:MAG: COG3014 family protein [Vibrio sp.]